jgi:hypothetical protein
LPETSISTKSHFTNITSTMPSSVRIPMPAGFLSLAPTTSSSYPLAATKSAVPASTPASSEPDAADAALPLTPTALAQVPVVVVADATKQRTESHSSTGSSQSGAGLRYLKLGPVHQGEHLDGAKGDWHEAAVE